MPEGPIMVILKEEVKAFKGKKVLAADGRAKFDISLLVNQTVTDFKTWGKHFIICFPKFSLRIHFMLFGKYSINQHSKAQPALHLHFNTGDLYFYTNSFKIIEGDLDEVYDWSADVMGDAWDAATTRKKLKERPEELVCDVLLDQNIFSGAGNIIKNEVLYRIKVHPLSKVGKLPLRKLNELIKETRQYSFEFLKWKKVNELRKHWLAHDQQTCVRCNLPLVKKDSLGKTKRRTFFCPNCQELYK